MINSSQPPAMARWVLMFGGTSPDGPYKRLCFDGIKQENKMGNEENTYVERFLELSPENQQRVIDFAEQLKEHQ